MRVPMLCRDSESFLEKIQGALGGGGPSGRCPSLVDLSMEPLLIRLEERWQEARLSEESPPVEGFATLGEREEWQSVLKAMRLRMSRRMATILRLLEWMWESTPLPVREDFLRAHSGVCASRYSERRHYELLLSPRIYREYLDFAMKLEALKAKAIERYMEVWRARRIAGSGFDARTAFTDATFLKVAGFLTGKESDGHPALSAAKEEEASTAGTGTVRATAALLVATESTDDDAYPLVIGDTEEIEAVPMMVAAAPTTVEAEVSEQHLQPSVEFIADSSLGETGVFSFPFDLGVADYLVLLGHPEEEVVLLEDPASESVEGGDSSIDGASSSSKKSSSGGTFVSWEGTRKYPFDRGKILGVRGADGESEGSRCWVGG